MSLGFYLKGNFPACLSFYVANRKNLTSLHEYFQVLYSIIHNSFFNPHYTVVITDANIKNNIAMSILHIISNCRDLSKKVHHAINVTITEAELFFIGCGISQACKISNTKKIFIVTNTIHIAKWIFDSSAHSFQIQSIKVVQCLIVFFNKNLSNTVKFWECPSKLTWLLHIAINKEMRQHKFVP